MTQEQQLNFITLDSRVYKYIRQFTVKSTQDALIELITNSIDAYRKKSQSVNCSVDITYQSPNILTVCDQAIGLTGDEMIASFLTVGMYTADTESRGFFSRGAKDICAIGNITFTAIKDGLLSQVYLNNDAFGKISIKDEIVTDEQRLLYGINDNGLNVTIDVLQNFWTKDLSGQAESISKFGVLRDIMMDQNCMINYTHINEIGEILFSRRLIFEYPKAQILLDLDYLIPDYPNHTANLKIYQSNTPIPQPKQEQEMVFGFLIKDSTTVYEVSTIDNRFRWNPHITHVFGSITCNAIHSMLIDFDTNGHSETNPTPIIDPSRLTGINKDHPFIQNLLSIPKVRLDAILHELNYSISKKSISLSDIDQLIFELEQYGLNILNDHNINIKFIPDYSSHLAKAIEDDRQKYITREQSYMIKNNYNIASIEFDRYVRDQLVALNIDPGTLAIAGPDGQIETLDYKQKQSDLDQSDISNIFDLIDSDKRQLLATNPYIYSLDGSNNLSKLFIFEKGRFDKIVNPENDYIEIKTKNFEIAFINNINLKSRYNIKYCNGVQIELNLANPIVKKYIESNTTEDSLIESDKINFDLENIASSQSLHFLKETMTEILSQIILENDVINSNIILDDENDYNRLKKISVKKNEIMSTIEIPLDTIFEKFITRCNTQKKDNIKIIVNNIEEKIRQLVDMSLHGGDLLLLKENLNLIIEKSIE